VREPLVTAYRNYLETHWVAKLRAAGKVEIDQEVLKTVNNH
jgi:peptidyl-prolyl cis-trans isomerase SurA